MQFYYVCMYDISKDRNHPMDKTHIKPLKTKIVQLHSKRVQSITIDTHEATLFQGKTTIFSNSYNVETG